MRVWALLLCASAHAEPAAVPPTLPAPAAVRGVPGRYEAAVSTAEPKGAALKSAVLPDDFDDRSEPKKPGRGLRLFGIELSGDRAPDANEPYNDKSADSALDWDIKARIKFDGLGARAKYRNPTALRSLSVGFLKYFDLPAAIGYGPVRDGLYDAVGATPDKPNGGVELNITGALNPYLGGSTSYDSRSSVSGDMSVERRIIGSSVGISPLGDNPGKPWNYTFLLGVSHVERTVVSPGWMSDRAGFGYSAGIAYQRALKDVSPRWLKRVKGRGWVDDSAVRSVAANAAVELTVSLTNSLDVTGGVTGRFMPSPEAGNPEEKTWDMGGIFGLDLNY